VRSNKHASDELQREIQSKTLQARELIELAIHESAQCGDPQLREALLNQGQMLMEVVKDFLK
jgi:hypothetical protein